jgi:hypothetical protein
MRPHRLALVCIALTSVAIGPPAASAFDQRIHKRVTREGLPFLRPSVVDAIASGNTSQDRNPEDKARPKHHFDSCYFDGATGYLREEVADTVDVLGADGRPLPLTAAREFGRMLHPAQDFYAHSNWVELGREDLLDNRVLGTWRHLHGWDLVRDDIVVGQGEDVPSGWRVLRATRYLPAVRTDRGERRRVLISGNTRFDPPGPGSLPVPDGCHDDMTLSHDELNKDGPTTDSPVARNYKRARRLAVRQTTHEWCRLLWQTRAHDGERAVAKLMGLWVDPHGFPHPDATRCSPRRGPVAWEVRIRSIKLTDTRDDDAGEINLAMVVYHRDLRGSTRRQVGPVKVERDHYVRLDPRRRPLRVCAEAGASPVLTVQGWDDDAGMQGVLDIAPPSFDPATGLIVPRDTDDTLAGITAPLSRPGTFTAGTSDLLMRYTVKRRGSKVRPDPDRCQGQAP